jgi:translation elongation factor EF-1alpha
MEQEIGKVVHYFDKAMVAVVGLTGDIAVGDTVKFTHGENESTQKVDSMQVEHKAVESGKAGDEVAIKVSEATHQNAKVYKVTE